MEFRVWGLGFVWPPAKQTNPALSSMRDYAATTPLKGLLAI